MMTPSELEALVQPVQAIAAVLTQLGVPGLLGLALAGPALIILAMLYFEHLRATRQEQAQAAYRDAVEKVLETYRSDTLNMLREVAKEHSEAVRFYNDNVELVQDYERMAEALQTIIVNNTRALERLVTIIETRERHV